MLAVGNSRTTNSGTRTKRTFKCPIPPRMTWSLRQLASRMLAERARFVYHIVRLLATRYYVLHHVVIELRGLRQLRIKAALSQRELAKRSGIAYSTIARLETGKTANMKTVRKLAEALGCEPSDLYGVPDDPAASSTDPRSDC